jgi:DNA repair protein RecN (Recombination protein N)
MAEGYDAVEFMVRTNPGAPPGPMKAIASGGELSRFVLAMKAALAAKENRTVIIFDEIDSGVGGAVADAVGERLLRLARDAQVLVVTHSPQVAARAVNHWRIEKTQTAKRAATRVSALSQGERVEEIARMLSGAEVTAEARAAAAKLLGAPAPALDAKRRRRA